MGRPMRHCPLSGIPEKQLRVGRFAMALKYSVLHSRIEQAALSICNSVRRACNRVPPQAAAKTGRCTELMKRHNRLYFQRARNLTKAQHAK
jgi:hypothetical protein